MGRVNFTGFLQIRRELEWIADKPEEFKNKTITFGDIFPASFMRKYTKFTSLYELFEKGGFLNESDEIPDPLDENELDKHISKNSRFYSWLGMVELSVKEYYEKQTRLKEVMKKFKGSEKDLETLMREILPHFVSNKNYLSDIEKTCNAQQVINIKEALAECIERKYLVGLQYMRNKDNNVFFLHFTMSNSPEKDYNPPKLTKRGEEFLSGIN